MLSLARINQHMATIICRDVFYLQTCGLIDYSLLLAFEVSTNKFEPEKIVEKRNETALFQAFSIAKKYGDLSSFNTIRKTANESIMLLNKSRPQSGLD